MRNCVCRISALVFGIALLAPACRASETRWLAQPKAVDPLDALIEADWTYQLAHSPMLARLAGDKVGANRWQDLSPEGLAMWQRHDENVLKEVRSLRRERLSRNNQATYDLFESEVEARVEEFHRRLYLAPFLSSEIRFWPTVPQSLTFAGQQFDSQQDYEAWLGRIENLPKFLTQSEALMREAMKARWTETKDGAQATLDFVNEQSGATVEDTVLFRPFRQFPEAVPPEARAVLVERARSAIHNRVHPALARFSAFVRDEYLPVCEKSPGLSHWPGGADLYEFLADQATGTKLSTGEMRALGERELGRIQKEMEVLLPKIGHGTTVPEVFEWIRSAPELHARTGGELLAAYRATAKRIDPTVGKVFEKLPRMPYGVDGIKAGRGLGGVYHRPRNGEFAGTVVVDIAKPEIRPTNEIVAIMLHEGVPGHHLQYALDQEQSPSTFKVREVLRHSQSWSSRDMGFVEGWGLYAESLGDELGLYEDPLDKFGELNLQLARAARVGIDTGIHGLGWDRKTATDYFVRTTGKPVSVASDEVDAAISNPGGLLSYTIGQLQFQALRSRAGRELGAKLNLRKFHNFLLAAGPLPFPILNRDLGEWIASEKRNN